MLIANNKNHYGMQFDYDRPSNMALKLRYARSILTAGSTALDTNKNGVDKESDGIENRQNDSTRSKEFGVHLNTT